MAGVLDLARSLGGIAELPVARAALGAWSAERGAGPFAEDLERLFDGIVLGREAHRSAGIVVASWIAHALASPRAASIEELGRAAGVERPLVRRVFGDARARASILPRARLADGNRAVYADISGVPSWLRRSCESDERYRAELIHYRTPGTRAFMIRGFRQQARWHHDPTFIGRLLDQPWARTVDAVTIAARRPSTPGIVLAVATRDRWFKEASVRRAIAENPFAPRPIYEILRLGDLRGT